jgi:hypothetical protein
MLLFIPMLGRVDAEAKVVSMPATKTVTSRRLKSFLVIFIDMYSFLVWQADYTIRFIQKQSEFMHLHIAEV